MIRCAKFTKEVWLLPMELFKPETLCSKHMIEYFVGFFNAVSGSIGF